MNGNPHYFGSRRPQACVDQLLTAAVNCAAFPLINKSPILFKTGSFGTSNGPVVEIVVRDTGNSFAFVHKRESVLNQQFEHRRAKCFTKIIWFADKIVDAKTKFPAKDGSPVVWISAV